MWKRRGEGRRRKRDERESSSFETESRSENSIEVVLSQPAHTIGAVARAEMAAVNVLASL